MIKLTFWDGVSMPKLPPELISRTTSMAVSHVFNRLSTAAFELKFESNEKAVTVPELISRTTSIVVSHVFNRLSTAAFELKFESKEIGLPKKDNQKGFKTVQLNLDFKKQELSFQYELISTLHEDQFLIENSELFECSICYDEVEVGQGIVLTNCQHNFCKECLIGQVKHSEEFRVKCPGWDPIYGICIELLQEREIRYLVPAEVFDRHLEMSLKNYERSLGLGDAVHCKTSDCRGFVEVDKNVRRFTCQVCKIINCIGCKAIHVGKNCQEYQDEINPECRKNREEKQTQMMIENMIAAGEAMLCPRCEIPVMKELGCDFITCFKCKLGICWVTKKPRHAVTKSNGDFVDGCHCKKNGQKCHPKCGNCH